jgi:hypothetical protein
MCYSTAMCKQRADQRCKSGHYLFILLFHKPIFFTKITTTAINTTSHNVHNTNMVTYMHVHAFELLLPGRTHACVFQPGKQFPSAKHTHLSGERHIYYSTSYYYIAIAVVNKKKTLIHHLFWSHFMPCKHHYVTAPPFLLSLTHILKTNTLLLS